MYMAPEQHLGKPIDVRCDVYSFCVALWEAVYRQRPFGGRSIVEIATNVLRGHIVEPAGGRIPGWLRKALLSGLAVDPDRRIPDMRTLIAELSRDRSRRVRRLAGAGALVATPLLGDLRDRLHPAATARTQQHVDRKHPLHEPRHRPRRTRP